MTFISLDLCSFSLSDQKKNHSDNIKVSHSWGFSSSQVGGMSGVSHMRTYQALIDDVSTARAFFLGPIDRHELCSLVKFGPT